MQAFQGAVRFQHDEELPHFASCYWSLDRCFTEHSAFHRTVCQVLRHAAIKIFIVAWEARASFCDKFVDRMGLCSRQYLPRKFKIAVTVPGDNSVDIFIHDVGLVVIMDPDGKTLKGYDIYVGGGMGRTHNKESTFARVAEPLGFVAKEDLSEVLKAILATQVCFCCCFWLCVCSALCVLYCFDDVPGLKHSR